jgi:hypothetical protein
MLSTCTLSPTLGAPEMDYIRNVIKERRNIWKDQLAWVCSITAHAEVTSGELQESLTDNTYLTAHEVCLLDLMFNSTNISVDDYEIHGKEIH